MVQYGFAIGRCSILITVANYGEDDWENFKKYFIKFNRDS